jgi:hypothetical protein
LSNGSNGSIFGLPQHFIADGNLQRDDLPGFRTGKDDDGPLSRMTLF